jgi:CIC family chloride channel protein
VPRFLATAIGMLGVGFIALHFPQVLGLGYGWLQLAILGNTDQFAVSTMLVLIPLKAVATTLTMSTHRGGVFAPMVFVGGMVGATMWGLLHAHVGWLPDGPAPLVIVGMLALFGGVARTPLAAVVIVAEMTRRAEMVPPAVVAIAVAYFISGRVRLYPEQSRSPGALQNGQSTE